MLKKAPDFYDSFEPTEHVDSLKGDKSSDTTGQLVKQLFVTNKQIWK